ncbi:putative RNA-binding Zn ribbon-like protein [Bradyrhizobium sp. USDA 4486]
MNVTKDLLDLAKHIVNPKTGRFDPEKSEDHYESQLIDLINQQRAGKPITPKSKPAAGNVVDLTEALRRSVGKAVAPAKKPKKASAGQKEMLMSIEGKKPAKEVTVKKPAKAQRKSARFSKYQGSEQMGGANRRIHLPGPKARRVKTYPLG